MALLCALWAVGMNCAVACNEASTARSITPRLFIHVLKSLHDSLDAGAAALHVAVEGNHGELGQQVDVGAVCGGVHELLNVLTGDVDANGIVDGAIDEAAVAAKLGDVDVAGHCEVEGVVTRGHQEDVAQAIADGHAGGDHLVDAGGVDLLDEAPVNVVGEVVSSGNGVAQVDAAQREGDVVEIAGAEQVLGQAHEHSTEAAVEDGVDAKRVDVDGDIAEIGVADGRVELKGLVSCIGLVANGI